MRILLIVNASASSVTARSRVLIQHRLSTEHDLTIAQTSRRGHATRLAQGAAADGVEVVAVLGGDGTLNEAANGLAGTATALGVLPGGSTNVFARTIGMANDPLKATDQLLAALGGTPADGSAPSRAGHGGIRAISLGNANGRYFLFHVGLGFDAAVVAEVEKRSLLKRYFGAVVFIGAAVATWRTYDRESPWFTATTPGHAPVDGYFAVGLNTSPYTFLGDSRLDVAPGTDLDSGLSLLVFERLTIPGLVAVVAASATRRATLPDAATPDAGASVGRRRLPLMGPSRLQLTRQVDQIEITGHRAVPYQVDGDYLGKTERLTIRCHPDALRLVVPGSAADAATNPDANVNPVTFDGRAAEGGS
jgi:diacylglycerol kinase family enzyme